MNHVHVHDNRKARRYAGLTIDTHAHWYPQAWMDFVLKDGPAQGENRAGCSAV